MTDTPECQVYFLKPVGFLALIKIGSSVHPVSRAISVSGISPIPVELIGSVPGTSEDESFLHRCFSHLHSHSEWFHATRDLQEAVKSILAQGMGFARINLTPTGKVGWRHRPRSPETRARMSVALQSAWARRKAHEKERA